jgi:hypothetical protein
LAHSRPRLLVEAVFVGLDYQSRRECIEQLARIEKERRVARSAVFLVAFGEGLVDQHAPGREGVWQERKERAVQVVRDHDAVELTLIEGPTAGLQVGFDELDCFAAD